MGYTFSIKRNKSWLMNNETDNQEHPKIIWELFIFGLLLTAFSLYMSYAILSSQQKPADASTNFVPILAKILDSKVIETTDSNATTENAQTHALHIHYEYEVNGKTYQSKKFSYLGDGYNRSKDATRVIRYYPVGSTQSAYYNPDNPAEAVLQRTMSSSISSSIFIPVLSVLVGFLCIFVGWKGSLRGLKKQV